MRNGSQSSDHRDTLTTPPPLGLKSYTFHNNFFFFSVFLGLDGPFGGNQTSWSDINHSLDFGSINKVQIRSGAAIDAIRVQYGSVWAPWHGGNGGNLNSPIELNGERIIKIQGKTSSYNNKLAIVQIEFHTNQGRKFGPYGHSHLDGVPWGIEREQCALTWIAGDSDKIVRSLSFNFQC